MCLSDSCHNHLLYVIWMSLFMHPKLRCRLCIPIWRSLCWPVLKSVLCLLQLVCVVSPGPVLKSVLCLLGLCWTLCCVSWACAEVCIVSCSSPPGWTPWYSCSAWRTRAASTPSTTTTAKWTSSGTPPRFPLFWSAHKVWRVQCGQAQKIGLEVKPNEDSLFVFPKLKLHSRDSFVTFKSLAW